MNTPAGESTLPAWTSPSDDPPIQAWAIDAHFSPDGRWDLLSLLDAFAEPTELLGASCADLLSQFARALAVNNQSCNPFPAATEIATLLELKEQRENDRSTILEQADFPNVRNFIVNASIQKLRPKLLDLLNDAYGCTLRPIFYVKRKLDRVRPYQLFPELAPSFLGKKFPLHPSFPSGHSTQAHLLVNVLEDVFGETALKKGYRDAAWAVGRYREIAGLHYPSDTAAGAVLAQVFRVELGRSTAYQRRCAEVRKDYGKP